MFPPGSLPLLLTDALSRPPSPGGRGEPAGLQRAARHGGAEEDGPPGPTEAAEEGCASESHPGPGPSAAPPPTFPQLPRRQSLQTGPEQDSRDRLLFAERGMFEVTEHMGEQIHDGSNHPQELPAQSG